MSTVNSLNSIKLVAEILFYIISVIVMVVSLYLKISVYQ